MNIKTEWFAVTCLLPLPFVAQAFAVITMDQEPHYLLGLPLLASGETHVQFVSVFPHPSTNLEKSSASRDASQAIVALDAATISSGPSQQKQREEAWQPGDFVRLDGGAGHKGMYQNRGDKEARFIEILFSPRIDKK